MVQVPPFLQIALHLALHLAALHLDLHLDLQVDHPAAPAGQLVSFSFLDLQGLPLGLPLQLDLQLFQQL